MECSVPLLSGLISYKWTVRGFGETPVLSDVESGLWGPGKRRLSWRLRKCWGFCRAPLGKESPFHCYQDVGHIPCRALLCSCSSAAPRSGKRALLCQTFRRKNLLSRGNVFFFTGDKRKWTLIVQEVLGCILIQFFMLSRSDIPYAFTLSWKASLSFQYRIQQEILKGFQAVRQQLEEHSGQFGSDTFEK